MLSSIRVARLSFPSSRKGNLARMTSSTALSAGDVSRFPLPFGLGQMPLRKRVCFGGLPYPTSYSAIFVPHFLMSVGQAANDNYFALPQRVLSTRESLVLQPDSQSLAVPAHLLIPKSLQNCSKDGHFLPLAVFDDEHLLIKSCVDEEFHVGRPAFRARICRRFRPAPHTRPRRCHGATPRAIRNSETVAPDLCRAVRPVSPSQRATAVST